ncbi:PAS domain S-box protein [Clostridium sp. C8-1-8]|uniref:PAS domain-containing hybrid sensor histidine kinase/response regulator n=1 Tax=Clostridium sp. C8-1-8 TaxID=2698831 RepID=UPI001371DFCD|nr:PAS domain S-box protein [Clostridium sp. C8-1-8]
MAFIDMLVINQELKAYRQIIDKINGIVLVFDVVGNIVMVNSEAMITYGYTENELLSMNVLDVSTQSTMDRFWDKFHQALEKEIEFESYNYKRNGAIFAVRIKSFGININDIDYVVSIISDVTDSKRSYDEIRYLYSISEETTDAIIGTDVEGIIKIWNRNAECIYGFSKEEVIGKNLFIDMFNKCGYDYFSEVLKVFKGEKIKDFEIIDLRKDGKKICISVTGSAVYSDNDIIGTLFFIRDITDRIMLVDKLNENQERLRMAIEGSQSGVWDFSINSGEVYYSEVFEKILGYDNDDYPRDLEKYIMTIHPDDIDAVRKAIDDAVLGDFLKVEHRMRRKDGKYVWVSSMGKVINNFGSSNNIRMVGLTKDITWQKKLEDKLRVNEERYRLLYGSMSQGVALGDAIYDDNHNIIDCKFVSVNKSFQEITGTEAVKCIGRSLLQVFPELEDWVYKGYQKATDNGVSHCAQFYCDFIHKYIDVQAYELKNGQIAIFVTDITDAVLKENQLKDNFKQLQLEKEKAERANQAKSQFLANMSHELRTPMNGILGIAQLMEFTEINEEQKEYINILKTSSNHLLKIINDLLDISKIEAGKEVISLEKYNFRESIEMIIQELSITASEKNLEALYYIDPLISEKVEGDQLKIRQILLNLISNAVKFTEKGHIYFKVKRVSNTSDKIKLQFSIEDSGRGIASSFREDIFCLFTQEDSSYTRKYGGTGLGLAISRKLANLMGGDIWFESEEGKGSTFYFTIELLSDEITKSNYCKEPNPLIKKADMPSNRKNILVAENDPMNALVIEHFLQNLMYEYHCVKDGEEVLVSMDKNKYDIILMDIQMPLLDGCETTKVIRSKERVCNKHIPIIAMTAYAMEGDKERFISCGIDDYLSKPIDLEALTNILRRYL